MFAICSSSGWTAEQTACWFNAPKINPQLLNVFRGADVVLKTVYCAQKNEANKNAFAVWMKMVGLDHYDKYETLISETPALKSYIFEEIKKQPEVETKLYSFKLYLDDFERKTVPGHTLTLSDQAGQGRFSHLVPGSMWTFLSSLNDGNARTSLLMLASTHVGIENSFAVGMYGDDSQKMPFDVSKEATLIPKIIDADLDITDALKKKIQELEITAGRPSPLAKAYHANLAAFMSCEMLKTGADPMLVETLQTLTAFGYRLSLLRTYYYQIKEKMAKGAPLSEDDKISLDAFNIINGNDHLPAPISTLSFFLHPHSEATLEFREAVLHLGQSWGWSTERAVKSNAKLREWALGKTWTLEQHKAGFRFAKKVCARANAR